MKRQIRILLLDDHSLFRESLSRLLEAEPDFRIAGTCATIEDALAVVDREPVDIVLLDYDLGDRSGTLFLEETRRRGFTGRVLMVTAGLPGAGSRNAFEGGSAGVFLKHSPPAELIQAIHKVVNGELWVDTRAVQTPAPASAVTSEERLPEHSLTGRERAVLKSVFEGLTSKEIAGRLDISESSVKATLQQLFDKTGVRTRSQLVRIALEKHAHDWLRDS